MTDWTNLEIATRLTHCRVRDGSNPPVIRITDAEMICRQMRDDYEQRIVALKAENARLTSTDSVAGLVRELAGESFSLNKYHHPFAYMSFDKVFGVWVVTAGGEGVYRGRDEAAAVRAFREAAGLTGESEQ